MNPFLIARAVLDGIITHALEARPSECCGVLVGRGDEILDAIRSPNLSSDPNRYELDPKVHIDARRRARARGLGLVGFYHSHPHSAAHPSPSDVAEASYEDAVYLVVGLAQDASPDVRLFRIARGQATEIPIAIDTATESSRRRRAGP